MFALILFKIWFIAAQECFKQDREERFVNVSKDISDLFTFLFILVFVYLC